MRECIVRLLQDYRIVDGDSFKEIEPQLLSLCKIPYCPLKIKEVFVENMLIERENGFDKEQMKVRDIYDSFRILNLLGIGS
jgi:hypothetical protein